MKIFRLDQVLDIYKLFAEDIMLFLPVRPKVSSQMGKFSELYAACGRMMHPFVELMNLQRRKPCNDAEF